jgi:hypothetical protein
VLSEEDWRAVKATERYAEGLADRGEWDRARRAVTAGSGPAAIPGFLAHAAVNYLLAEAGPDPVRYALDVSPWAASAGRDRDGELGAQAAILRCQFGSPPFRPVTMHPEWLNFSDHLVPRLAEGIWQEGALDRLPILADALADAGCDDAGLLSHLRGPSPHARGCHALDAVRAGPSPRSREYQP